MKYFLASSIVDYKNKTVYKENKFLEKIKENLAASVKALYICSSPNNYFTTDLYANEMKAILLKSGINIGDFNVLDNRSRYEAQELIAKVDLIILAGGHVPTQNKFFNAINLAKLLETFSGLIIASSAGSMNSANLVYSQPELEGEALDKNYQRFLPGLAISNTNIIPHYQDLKDEVLDGLRLLEDMTLPDSKGREFLALVDGSYIFGDLEEETICGESYLIKDGLIKQITKLGEEKIIKTSNISKIFDNMEEERKYLAERMEREEVKLELLTSLQVLTAILKDIESAKNWEIMDI